MPVDLWALIKLLPLYGSLQVPSRFLAAVVLVLAFASGIGADGLWRWLSARKRSLAITVCSCILLAVSAEQTITARRLFGDIFVFPPIELPRFESFGTRVADATGGYYPAMSSFMMPILSSNSGLREGYENVAITRGEVTVDGTQEHKGEVWLTGNGNAEFSDWTMSDWTVQ